MSLSATSNDCETTVRHLTLIDTPGNDEYFKHAVPAIAQADVAVLVVDAKSLAEDLNSCVRKCSACAQKIVINNIKQIIVCINGMDKVEWARKVFDMALSNLKKMLKANKIDVGEKRWHHQTGGKKKGDKKKGAVKPRAVILATSGFAGDGIKTSREGWDASTLIDLLDMARPIRQKPADGPLRCLYCTGYDIKDVGTVVATRVVSGTLRQGMKIVIQPKGKTAIVKSIKREDKDVKGALPGDCVTMVVDGVKRKDISRSSVICAADSPAPIAAAMFCQVKLLRTKTENGYKPLMYCGSADVPCEFKTICMAKSRGGTTTDITNTEGDVVAGDNAGILVWMQPTKPIVVDPDMDRLNRIVLFSENTVEGIGAVLAMQPAKPADASELPPLLGKAGKYASYNPVS